MSGDGKIQVIITDWAGGKAVTARLPTNAPVSQLLPALVKKLQMPKLSPPAGGPLESALFTKLQLPSYRPYFLTHKESGKRLDDNDTPASAGVSDGDTLRILPNVRAQCGFFVHKYRDVQLIQLALEYRGCGSVFETRSALFAVFLYTAADEALAQFIRNNFLELHYASGRHLFFFIVEKPAEQAWIDAVRQELEIQLGDRYRALHQVWGRMQRNQLRTLESEKEVEEMRELLGVNRSQMPCAVFFSSLAEREVLTVPFERLLGGPPGSATAADMLKMFRALFDLTEQAAQAPPPYRLSALQRAIGAGPVGVPARARVYSPIAVATLTATVEAAIAAIIQRLLK